MLPQPMEPNENQEMLLSAISDFNEAIRLKPSIVEEGDGDILLNRGRCYLQTGQLFEAVSDLKQLLSHHPDNVNAAYTLSLCYKELSQTDKEIAALERVIELRPDGHIAYNRLGEIYISRSENEKAVKCFDKAIELIEQKQERK